MKSIKKHLGKLKGVSELPEVKISSGSKFQAEPVANGEGSNIKVYSDPPSSKMCFETGKLF